MANYYMVRAMRSSDEELDVFFRNNTVAVGWSEVDFTEFKSIDEVVNTVKSCYYSKNIAPQVVGKKLNEVRRFIGICKGDYIVIPYHNAVRFAIATDDLLYDDNSYSLDLANQRKVNFIYDSANEYKTVLRDELSEALQRRLRVRGSTVSDLNEFNDEIERLVTNDTYTWDEDFDIKEKKAQEVFKNSLLKKIQNGGTHLKTGGIGLEHLVKELFTCEGYKAEVLAKTNFADSADADVSAVKEDRFHSVKILAQVKHHNGYSDDKGIQQLEQIRTDTRYSDYSFLFITSAKISDNVRTRAENSDIMVMDGNDLVEWLLENINEISDRTKILLNLSSVPQLID